MDSKNPKAENIKKPILYRTYATICGLPKNCMCDSCIYNQQSRLKVINDKNKIEKKFIL